MAARVSAYSAIQYPSEGRVTMMNDTSGFRAFLVVRPRNQHIGGRASPQR
jgi:hypothetical protein